jgi:hypothetical protein
MSVPSSAGGAGGGQDSPVSSSMPLGLGLGRKRRRLDSPHGTGPGGVEEWIVRTGQWRLRIQAAKNGKAAVECVLVAVKLDAMSSEQARNSQRVFLPATNTSLPIPPGITQAASSSSSLGTDLKQANCVLLSLPPRACMRPRRYQWISSQTVFLLILTPSIQINPLPPKIPSIQGDGTTDQQQKKPPPKTPWPNACSRSAKRPDWSTAAARQGPKPTGRQNRC